MSDTIKIEMARKHWNKIVAYADDGSTYILNHRFAGPDCPKLIETLMKIRKVGSITRSRWTKSARRI